MLPLHNGGEQAGLRRHLNQPPALLLGPTVQCQLCVLSLNSSTQDLGRPTAGERGRRVSGSGPVLSLPHKIPAGG